MRKHLYLFCIVLSIMLIACTNATPDMEMVRTMTRFNVTVDAQLPDICMAGPFSKASLAYTVRLNWHAGDAISVVNLTTGKTLAGNLYSDLDSSRSTFSGTLSGTVTSTDKLLFIYPSQNYTSEAPFMGVSLTDHYAGQSGIDSSEIPFFATAEGTLSGLAASCKPLDFVFGMSFFQVNLGNLPEEQEISSVTLRGFNNSVEYAYSGGRLVPTYSSGDIVLNPASLSSSSGGCRTMYFTCLPQDVSERSVTVDMGGESYSTDIPSNPIALNTGYNLNLPSFVRDDVLVLNEITMDYEAL